MQRGVSCALRKKFRKAASIVTHSWLYCARNADRITQERTSKMKRMLLISLPVAAALMVAGCNKEEKGASEEAAKPAAESAAEKANEAAEAAKEAADKAGEAAEKAGEAASKAMDAAKDAGQAAMEKAGDAANEAMDAAKDASGAAMEKAGEAMDAAKDAAGDAMKAAKDAADKAGHGHDRGHCCHGRCEGHRRAGWRQPGTLPARRPTLPATPWMPRRMLRAKPWTRQPTR
ncbi:MAG: hypothetical protein H6891_06765 [Brucellaceae bacterium]|nr:hypothetical protein [Brucellaceae bacterium]